MESSRPERSATHFIAKLVYNKVMEDSLFSKIIKGEIPCHKIYEDDRTFAFLDIHPIQPGHTLVVPKKQVEFVWDLDNEDYHALMTTAKLIVQHLKQAFPEKARIAMIIEGLDVAHAHIKIFPFDNDTEFRYIPDLTVEPDHKTLSDIASKLAF